MKRRLGRRIDIELRIELALPEKPTIGPIEFFRRTTR
jgi:hypothetical protein